ncbi:MAG: hypothetical protein ACYTAQ_05055, partial [Planctomycetota bacterium]
KWNEIKEIKENNILERLIVIDILDKTIRLEYQLEKMSDLLNAVFENIPHLIKEYSQIRKFYRTKHIHIFFGGFSCLIVYTLLIEFTGVSFNSDGLVIIFPLWKKEIKFSQIKKVTLEKIRGGNGKSSPFVILELIGGKKVKLNALREGTLALYSAIKRSMNKGFS